MQKKKPDVCCNGHQTFSSSRRHWQTLTFQNILQLDFLIEKIINLKKKKKKN
jgi:hypothetical protein